MKKYTFFLLLFASGFFFSCDKVDNPFPPAIQTDLDTTIYPGNWSDYLANEWPDFDALPDDNPERNVLIEDFTGHNCSYCPAAVFTLPTCRMGCPLFKTLIPVKVTRFPFGTVLERN